MWCVSHRLRNTSVSCEVKHRLADKHEGRVLQGAGKLLRDSRKHPAQLRSEVSTPGGTTIYGLHTLEQGGVRAATMSAVESATERARELGLKSAARSTK